MCGRYAVFDEEDMSLIREIMAEVVQRLSGTPAMAQWRPGEIAPTNVAPILLPDQTATTGWEPALMKWGFPSYRASAVVFNARRETLREKPMFRGRMAQGRCVVPASAFYEWQAVEGTKKKAKFDIRPSGQPLLMAGLCGAFHDLLGQPYNAYTIVTTAAQGAVADIHDRMPLMLDVAAARVWLDKGATAEAVDSLVALTEVTIRKCG